MFVRRLYFRLLGLISPIRLWNDIHVIQPICRYRRI